MVVENGTYLKDTGKFFVESKAAGADHLPSAEVKNTWKYSSLPICLHLLLISTQRNFRLLVTATENYFEPEWSSRHDIATGSLLLFTVCRISYEDFQRTFCVHFLFPILAACHTSLIIRDFFTIAQQPSVGHGLLITEASQ